MDSQSSSKAMEWSCISTRCCTPFDDAGMEIAEEFAAQGGGAALLAGDFDVSAVANVGAFGKRNGHGTTPKKNARLRVNL